MEKEVGYLQLWSFSLNFMLSYPLCRFFDFSRQRSSRAEAMSFRNTALKALGSFGFSRHTVPVLLYFTSLPRASAFSSAT